ncbi:MAG: trigger factor [Xanthomonadales bacterium]|nr:trigger factor [Xanthomonadales bacterium]
MQVSVENTGTLGRLMKIHVPAEQIDNKISARLKKMSREVHLKGFRPGRVPISVVKQRFGQQVRQEIIGQTIQESLGEAFRQENLAPVGRPKVEPINDSFEAGDLEYTAEFEVFPDMGETDISALEIAKPNAKVSDKDVSGMITTLQQQRAVWGAVKSKTKKGNRVALEFVAEAGDIRHPAIGKERIMVMPDGGGMPEAFENATLGHKAGDTVEVDVDFPEGFRIAELAGKTAKVSMEINVVEAAVMPDIDAEFVKLFGIDSGEVDELQVEIRNNLERELATATTSLLKLEVTNKLLEARKDLEVPATLIQEEAANLQKADVQRLQQNGIENPQEQPLELYLDAAQQRVMAGLLFSEIARANAIQIDGERVRDAIESIAQTFEQPAQVVELYYNNQNLLAGVENSVLEEQVVDWVLTQAQVKKTKMNFQEVIQTASRGR